MEDSSEEEIDKKMTPLMESKLKPLFKQVTNDDLSTSKKIKLVLGLGLG